MLEGHGEEDLFKRIRVIVDERQDTTEAKDKMVEELPVDFGFDAIDQFREGRDEYK